MPRYGHSQITLDNAHMLVIGGCGGPNMVSHWGMERALHGILALTIHFQSLELCVNEVTRWPCYVYKLYNFLCSCQTVVLVYLEYVQFNDLFLSFMCILSRIVK